MFTDANYARHRHVTYKRSILRYFMLRCKFGWKNNKVNVVARSNVETKFRAMAYRVCELL